MTPPVFVPEDHLIAASAILSPEEAGAYLPPGRHRARGRIGAGPVVELVVDVHPSGVARVRPAEALRAVPA